MEEIKIKCKDCKWWDKLPKTAYGNVLDNGFCRRRSPENNYMWPVTIQDDWCGDFELNGK